MRVQNTLLLNNIQMLRALAALLVVFHHALPHYALLWVEKIAFIATVSEVGIFGC